MSDFKRLHFHQVWLVIGISFILGTIYFSLTSSGIPSISHNVNDKFLHITGYFMLTLWFSQIYYLRLQRLLLMTGFILMGIGLEFIQGYGGVRHYEIADMVANSVGVLAGLLAAAAGMDRILAWFERRLKSAR